MPAGFTTKGIDFSSPQKATLGIGLNPAGLIAKASLVNLDTNETYKFLFNPTTVKNPPVKAVYHEKNVAFRSHPRLQYSHTSGKDWVFQLYLNSISSGAQSVINILAISRNINNDTAFLESLVYPLANRGIKNRRPPKVRFVWPKLANVKVRVMEVGTAYQQFNFRLQQKVTLIDLVLREDPDTSVTSNLVRQRGANNRPGLLGALLDKLPPGVGEAVDTVTSII